MLKTSKKISALNLCADILDYPTNEYIDKVNSLENITGIKIAGLKNIEEIGAEYIRIFSIHSKEFRCVRYASWWIDGKMGGKSLKKIVDFYQYCGYAFDSENIKKPADDISVMLTFVAILLEDDRLEELKEFAKFLPWLTDFANSLKSASDMGYFWFAADIASRLILKEEV